MRIKTLGEALSKQKDGVLVCPDPSDPQVQDAYAKGACPNFFSYSRLPMWTEETLTARMAQLRELDMKNLYFKMAGYDPADMERVLRIAAAYARIW